MLLNVLPSYFNFSYSKDFVIIINRDSAFYYSVSLGIPICSRSGVWWFFRRKNCVSNFACKETSKCIFICQKEKKNNFQLFDYFL